MPRQHCRWCRLPGPRCGIKANCLKVLEHCFNRWGGGSNWLSNAGTDTHDGGRDVSAEQHLLNRITHATSLPVRHRGTPCLDQRQIRRYRVARDHFEQNSIDAAWLGLYDELVIAIRCSRLFSGERFSGGPATVLLDGGKSAGIESRQVELDASWRYMTIRARQCYPGSSTPMFI